jgi:hypothetical protein
MFAPALPHKSPHLCCECNTLSAANSEIARSATIQKIGTSALRSLAMGLAQNYNKPRLFLWH